MLPSLSESISRSARFSRDFFQILTLTNFVIKHRIKNSIDLTLNRMTNNVPLSTRASGAFHSREALRLFSAIHSAGAIIRSTTSPTKSDFKFHEKLQVASAHARPRAIFIAHRKSYTNVKYDTRIATTVVFQRAASHNKLTLQKSQSFKQ